MPAATSLACRVLLTARSGNDYKVSGSGSSPTGTARVLNGVCLAPGLRQGDRAHRPTSLGRLCSRLRSAVVISDRMAVSKDLILSEIQRLAKENGEPPGQKRFHRETGINDHEWRGRHWARWTDALAEAGFAPNEWVLRYGDDAVLASLAGLIRDLGRFPTYSETGLRHHTDPNFPSLSVF